MFILKKIIGQLFLPVPLCLEMLIVGLLLLLFTRKQRTGKIILSVGVILFTLLSYPALSNTSLRRLEYQYPPLISTATSDFAPGAVVPQVRWIVVLGGGYTSDPKISITSQLSDPSLGRLIEAIRLDRKSTRLNSSHGHLVCRLLLEKKKTAQQVAGGGPGAGAARRACQGRVG